MKPVVTPVTKLSQTLVKALSGNADEDGSGTVSVGDTLTYTVTLTNTSASGALSNVTVTDSKITPNSQTCASVAAGATCVLTGTYVVTAADATGRGYAGALVGFPADGSQWRPGRNDGSLRFRGSAGGDWRR